MPQKKGTKKIKVRDLKPRKDAKGGVMFFGSTHQQGAGKNPSNAGHGVAGAGHGTT